MKSSDIVLKLQWTDHSRQNLSSRIARLKSIDRPIDLDPVTKAILFLRGAASRASFVLPAFYTNLGSRAYCEGTNIPYSKQVFATSQMESSLHTISLTCRSIFDESRKGMTGKSFSLVSDTNLTHVAEYWASRSGLAPESAAMALGFLRKVFHMCSKPRKELLNATCLLERRIGLLKHHADRHAAHISIEPFLFDLSDLVHVAASISILGAMIVDFDDRARGDMYFDKIDEAAWQSCKEHFTELPVGRLFGHFNILQQSRNYWKLGLVDGIDMLFNGLPAALGYWDSENEVTKA